MEIAISVVVFALGFCSGYTLKALNQQVFARWFLAVVISAGLAVAVWLGGVPYGSLLVGSLALGAVITNK